MKRVIATVAISASFVSPAVGQSAVTRDGAVEQAIQDTMSAHMNRRAVAVDDPKRAATKAAMSGAIDEATITGGTVTGNTTARTWTETIRGLIYGAAHFIWPTAIGKAGDKPPFVPGGGGGFGGGGSDFTWTDELDCSAVKIELDAAGNLILPSYSLDVGKPIQFVPVGSTTPNHWAEGPNWRASSMEAVGRWWTHILNGGRTPERWFGVVRPYNPGGSQNTCIQVATKAYRDASNNVVAREVQNACFTQEYVWNYPNHSGVNLERQCPQDPSVGSSDFHFYGAAEGWNGQHLHACYWYVPNAQLGGESGYRINKFTTVAFNGTVFPAQLPPAYKQCALDKNFIKRLTDAVYKKAAEKPGYSGVPYQPVATEDARPNDTKVVDLQDEPVSGADPAPNPVNVTNPPPADPPPATTTNVTVDFGPNPNVGSPTLEDAPTNILDPVFDWLPDLPSIQLNVAGAQCPTWQMQPFDGPEWTLVMDDHCPFIADNASLISTIMLLGFTVGAAMIILRA